MLTDAERKQKEEDRKKLRNKLSLEYYHFYKETICAKRKEKYRTDKAVREAAAQRQKDNRARNKVILPDGCVLRTTPSGKDIVVVKLSKAAEMLGVSASRIWALEQAGIIPRPSFTGTRAYTDRQIALMGQLFSKLKEVEPSMIKAKEVKEYMKKALKLGWGGGL